MLQISKLILATVCQISPSPQYTDAPLVVVESAPNPVCRAVTAPARLAGQVVCTATGCFRRSANAVANAVSPKPTQAVMAYSPAVAIPAPTYLAETSLVVPAPVPMVATSSTIYSAPPPIPTKSLAIEAPAKSMPTPTELTPAPPPVSSVTAPSPSATETILAKLDGIERRVAALETRKTSTRGDFEPPMPLKPESLEDEPPLPTPVPSPLPAPPTP